MQHKEGWRAWDEAGETRSVLTGTELDVKRHVTSTELLQIILKRGGKYGILHCSSSEHALSSLRFIHSQRAGEKWGKTARVEWLTNNELNIFIFHMLYWSCSFLICAS